MASDPILTKEEFCARFKAHILKHCKPFDDEYLAKYAEETAPSYYDRYYAEADAFSKTPEDCADSDMSY